MNIYRFDENVGKIKISSVDKYIDGMSKSMNDKLFFLSKINPDVIVDFGCADGSVISEIRKRKPEVKLIGYDIDDDMISRAQSKNKNVLFTNSWDTVLSEIKGYRFPCLNLSSVIHEVYSYSNSKSIKEFWEKFVFGSNFEWITIRDMIPSTEMSKNEMENFINDVKKIKSSPNKYIQSFEDRWGIIDSDYRTLTHYLLKYKFQDNWDREVLENYMPLSIETLKKKIPSEYSIVYENRFILDYLKKEVYKDFGIVLRHSTHAKLIIKRD